jgi:hypothetical protein
VHRRSRRWPVVPRRRARLVGLEVPTPPDDQLERVSRARFRFRFAVGSPSATAANRLRPLCGPSVQSRAVGKAPVRRKKQTVLCESAAHVQAALCHSRAMRFGTYCAVLCRVAACCYAAKFRCESESAQHTGAGSACCMLDAARYYMMQQGGSLSSGIVAERSS